MSGVDLAASGLPPRYSCTLVSLTLVRLKSAISKVFLSSNFPSRFSCTCVSIAYVKPTRVLCDQKRKQNVKRLWILKAPRLDFEATLVYLGILWGPFIFCP